MIVAFLHYYRALVLKTISVMNFTGGQHRDQANNTHRNYTNLFLTWSGTTIRVGKIFLAPNWQQKREIWHNLAIKRSGGCFVRFIVYIKNVNFIACRFPLTCNLNKIFCCVLRITHAFASYYVSSSYASFMALWVWWRHWAWDAYTHTLTHTMKSRNSISFNTKRITILAQCHRQKFTFKFISTNYQLTCLYLSYSVQIVVLFSFELATNELHFTFSRIDWFCYTFWKKKFQFQTKLRFLPFNSFHFVSFRSTRG